MPLFLPKKIGKLTTNEKNVLMRNQELKERVNNNKLQDQNHLEEIITIYLKKLEKQLQEKNLLNFFIFSDNFNKIIGVTYDNIETFLKQDVKKYANRCICYVNIDPNYKSSKKNVYDKNIWLSVNIKILHIGAKCNIIGKKINSHCCDIIWQANDFLTTKFTFKLLETIVHILVENNYNYIINPQQYIDYRIGFIPNSGYTISCIIRDLKIKGHDISTVLSPLGIS